MAAFFVVQTFSKIKGGMRPDLPVQAQNTAHARRMAERLSLQKEAVVAFMREGDPSTGDYDEPLLIATFGELPDEIMQLQRVN
ncbi:hypothetical protein [Phyllobacterium ifriqiyense]|uniref:hypothetical protein n=1 Tax=Phyllobacterium ifriqiyense TaxID=314238 RepID=UPI003394A662